MPALGPLHLLLPVPRTHSPQLTTRLAPSLSLFLCSDVPSWEKPVLTTLSESVLSFLTPQPTLFSLVLCNYDILWSLEFSPTPFELHAGLCVCCPAPGDLPVQSGASAPAPAADRVKGARQGAALSTGAGGSPEGCRFLCPLPPLGLSFLKKQMSSLNLGFLPRRGGQDSSWPHSYSQEEISVPGQEMAWLSGEGEATHTTLPAPSF